MKIQMIEIQLYEGPIYCMFCGQAINEGQGSCTPCPHLLFLATEEAGPEYCSPRVEKWFAESDDENDDRSWYDRAQAVELPDAFGFLFCGGTFGIDLLTGFTPAAG